MVYIAKSSKIVILGQPAAAIRVWTTSGHRSYYWQRIAFVCGPVCRLR
jgi:hypothetical protein